MKEVLYRHKLSYFAPLKEKLIDAKIRAATYVRASCEGFPVRREILQKTLSTLSKASSFSCHPEIVRTTQRIYLRPQAREGVLYDKHKLCNTLLNKTLIELSSNVFIDNL